jgi:hypothetical protein
MPATAQTAIAVVGIDIGKNSFHIVGLDDRGAIVLRQKWSRNQVEARFANTPPCLIGMEACVGAHHLSRKLNALGHDARLMPARYVRPFSKGQKDAERARGCLHIAHLQRRAGVADIGEDGEPPKTGNNIAQNFQSLGGEIVGLQRKAGHIAAPSGKACDKAGAKRVRRNRKHDRDCRGRLFCLGNCAPRRDNDVDFEPNKTGRDFDEAIVASFRPVIYVQKRTSSEAGCSRIGAGLAP